MGKNTIQNYLSDPGFEVQSECAISLIKTKLKIIDSDLSMHLGRNVINTTTSRIKTYDSIVSKLDRKGYHRSLAALKENVQDIVGVRAVCHYTDDLYNISNRIIRQDDIDLIKIKDYILKPKASGYRSLHLILSVQIPFQDDIKRVTVELQLRTSAMDYWANLDYQLRYKKGKKEAAAVGADLKDYAEVIFEMDKNILEIRKRIEAI